ncbi:E3 ubiquitin-protein ligase WAV3 [Lolium perenne]|uniref:E3 ubiquitin-protein ligase WAV3 n=1 Tax=Lolium perenne TaxID=4522 RepID=UPI0021F65872|nr:E3 ubiquitin-protein ligase WAV3-like [Lolium perenne]
MEGPDQTNPCAICLGSMRAGGGQATFTAECSHTFHFSCISTSVAHGNLVCPLCNAQWRDLPFVRPTSVPQPPPGHILQHRQPPPAHIMQHRQPPPAHILQRRQLPNPTSDPVVVFDDDEQVEPVSGPTGNRQTAPAGAASNGAVVVNTHAECSAVARDSSSDNFAVLVHVRAPGMIETDAAPRAPLDLVTVLDVSGSMSGQKLALLKQAMRFVVDNLGPNDRLSVVSFSSDARRVTRLARMTDAGKASCISTVESLAARGGTNIAEGLRTAAKVLDERRHRNPVSSVVLLSDGQDTYTSVTRRGGGANYEALVPPSFLRTDGEWSAPIHTFGFGNDHDAAAMHVIAESTGGTFSFIENEAVIQDAFAQCIGGLLSVVVQEARIAVTCVHPGVRVISVRSGRYESRVDEDGRAATVRVGELYADEERRFLLFLAVPRAEAADGNNTMCLVKVVCSYKDAATGGDVSVTAEDVVVARPENAGDTARSVEVERERLRVEAAEDIAAARAAAERGAHEEAVGILENRQRVVAQSGDGDAVIVALGAELLDMRERVSSRQSYLRSGRAYMLAGMSAHAQQRANSRQMMQEPVNQSANSDGLPRMVSFRAVGSAAVQDEATLSYSTPAMRAMLLRSRNASAMQEPVNQSEKQSTVGDDAQSSQPEANKT